MRSKASRQMHRELLFFFLSLKGFRPFTLHFVNVRWQDSISRRAWKLEEALRQDTRSFHFHELQSP
jgi:hypothetical protein